MHAILNVVGAYLSESCMTLQRYIIAFIMIGSLVCSDWCLQGREESHADSSIPVAGNLRYRYCFLNQFPGTNGFTSPPKDAV